MSLSSNPSAIFLLEETERAELWRELTRLLEEYIRGIRDLPASSNPSPPSVRSLLSTVDFSRPMPPAEAVRFAAHSLARTQVHTPHPRYYGLFNPTPATVSIAADALVAAFNPQLAVWRHNPFAVEVEQHLIRSFAALFGYDPSSADGTFTSGGSEANHTALLVSLVHAFPYLESKGLRGLAAQPVLYVSAESHHSFHKAARLCGLGNGAVREIPVDDNLQMQPAALESAIRADRRNGFAPFLVVGTVGTTNAGAIDPLSAIAEIAARDNLWFHADAAWGGAAAVVPELRPLLAGIERADSITLDAHKWLSVPNGAGILLTRHPDILGHTFHVSAAYVPPKPGGPGIVDPYEHSIHWSRRFIGLKLFLSLLVAGWKGYAAVLRHMTAMGDELRRRLQAAGWLVVESGRAWISTTRVRGNVTVLRACVTSYRTNPDDIAVLVQALEAARSALKEGSAGSVSR